MSRPIEHLRASSVFGSWGAVRPVYELGVVDGLRRGITEDPNHPGLVKGPSPLQEILDGCRRIGSREQASQIFELERDRLLCKQIVGSGNSGKALRAVARVLDLGHRVKARVTTRISNLLK